MAENSLRQLQGGESADFLVVPRVVWLGNDPKVVSWINFVFFGIRPDLVNTNMGDLSDLSIPDRAIWDWCDFPLVNQHSYGKLPSLIGTSIMNGSFSIALLTYHRVLNMFTSVWHLGSQVQACTGRLTFIMKMTCCFFSFWLVVWTIVYIVYIEYIEYI